MKLTLMSEASDRFLERHWDLTDAEPVMSYPLMPAREFTPVDLRIWWKTAHGHRPTTCRAHAWPAKGHDPDHTFASWSDVRGSYPAAMPQWVQDMSEVVRTDLADNRMTPSSGTTDIWGYGNDRRWAVEDAAPVTNTRGQETVPAELDISWSFYPDRPEHEHRYSVYAYSAGRGDRTSVQWGGTRSWQGPDLPDWIRDLVDAQYEDLAAAGKSSTAERVNH
ncbi:hypothetical protein IV500_04790 [Paeniglutamicibacter antarcticus]|uniref:Uncharacterized protein n=1 Tax=Arthrobacter terrae TaxID=2935737 RepID=A0A931CLM0_9MICC|nr:hypothetical protein [Arthrobacter terrae]MBG0738735.1 hypothetical protein [Arthrobacter terrae]